MRDDSPIPNFGLATTTPSPGMLNTFARLVEQTFRNFAATGRAKFSTINIQPLTVATLPLRSSAGDISYASDGRKNGEGPGVGTGVLVFFDGTNWIACDNGQTVVS